MMCKCGICGCEYVHVADENVSHDGEIKVCRGTEGKKVVNICLSCASEILDYVEQLREEYGYYEED